MKQYIDKADVIAEIERKKAYAQTLGDNAINSSMQQFYDGMREGCNNLLSFLNTLEVKEVDLEKEIEKYLLTNAAFLIVEDSKLVVYHIAEHFFKLGIQQAQKGE